METALPGSSSSPVGSAAISPAATTMSTWPRLRRPIPRTFPVSRWTGRIADRITSTTLVAFSSTTPVATASPALSSAM